MTIQALYDLYRQHPIVTTDSRNVPQDSIFFALKGERFDGNQFVAQALEKGAAYAVHDDITFAIDERCIVVNDTLETLQQLATYHRRTFHIPIIAITGSNGKTTTKELIASVMGSHYATHFTKGNLNNHIGVPLTLLAMPNHVEVAIIEMGMNHLGEIAALCEIAEPTHGIITNIGKAHLEGVGGTIEGVKQAKSELFKYLKKRRSVVFVNRDEPFLSELAEGNKKIINYSQQQSLVDHFLYQVIPLATTPFVHAQFQSDDQEKIVLKTRLNGVHNFQNVMTAIAIGQYFKVPAQKIRMAIENYVPSNNRSQIIYHQTNIFIMDAYNANPSSMKSALDYFHSYIIPRKVAILGDMLELGAASLQEHKSILDHAETLAIDEIILVGTNFGKINSHHRHFETTQAFKVWFEQNDFAYTGFLVKGSRGMRMEEAVQSKLSA